MAGEALRRKKAGVHRRERFPHLHDSLEGEGSERREGVRQGAKKPGQEPDAHRLRHAPRRDGRGPLDRGLDRLRALRDLLRRGIICLRHSLRCVVLLVGVGAQDGRVETSSRSGERISFPTVVLADSSTDRGSVSKIKTCQDGRARTREALNDAICDALEAITPQMRGWFHTAATDRGSSL